MSRILLILSLLPLFLIGGCAQYATIETEKPDEMVLKSMAFGDVPQWGQDNMDDFALAYARSCERILKKDSQAVFHSDPRFGLYQEWQIACRKFQRVNKTNRHTIQRFFEDHFLAYAVHNNKKAEGLFTGYYEAALNGSRTKQGVYQYPLRARPDDLVMVHLGNFREELKGQRIAGRVKNGALTPYETHEEIIKGELPPDQDRPIVYVDDPADAFFIQIQGSGIVRLDDGSIMRLGYAGQNGHPYYAIGRELVALGELSKEDVSLQSIRQWMSDHPNQAQELMLTNKSYVFFEEKEGEGPVGGEGVALTPMRSIAIDHSLIPYGIPIWLAATHPDSSQNTIHHLVMAQDTGGAIRGPVRGDLFWGYGAEAENYAGQMKSQGRYWFLIPKKINPVKK